MKFKITRGRKEGGCTYFIIIRCSGRSAAKRRLSARMDHGRFFSFHVFTLRFSIWLRERERCKCASIVVSSCDNTIRPLWPRARLLSTHHQRSVNKQFAHVYHHISVNIVSDSLSMCLCVRVECRSLPYNSIWVGGGSWKISPTYTAYYLFERGRERERE